MPHPGNIISPPPLIPLLKSLETKGASTRRIALRPRFRSVSESLGNETAVIEIMGSSASTVPLRSFRLQKAPLYLTPSPCGKIPYADTPPITPVCSQRQWQQNSSPHHVPYPTFETPKGNLWLQEDKDIRFMPTALCLPSLRNVSSKVSFADDYESFSDTEVVGGCLPLRLLLQQRPHWLIQQKGSVGLESHHATSCVCSASCNNISFLAHCA